MVDIVLKKLTKAQFKKLKLLKIKRDSKSWTDMFIALVHEWENLKETEKGEAVL